MTEAAHPRLWGIVVAGLSLAMLLTGAALAPDDEGHGTHTQLGLPECGWAQRFDQPCFTCGMTTAVSHAASGSMVESFTTQPAGMLVAVLGATLFWFGLHAAATGSRLDLILTRMLSSRALTIAGAVVVAAWIYKVVTWAS